MGLALSSIGDRRSMSLTIYDISVPVFRQTLTALGGVLDRAVAHCAATRLDPRTFVEARLIHDMAPFAFHIASVLNNSTGAVDRLCNTPFIRAEGLDSLPAMKAATVAACAALAAVARADLKGAATREIVLSHPRGDRCFSGQDYLLTLALPNFFFHAATGYDILRAQGVPLGKRDFLGPLPPRRPARNPALVR